MRRLRILLSAGIIISATPALAEAPTPQIRVTGQGSIFTPPDLAIITYSLHGEGKTSDEALRMLVAKREAVERGVAGFASEKPTGGNIAIQEVRSPECNTDDYDAPRQNTGPCAIIGYVADLGQELKTTDVQNAATMAGLLGRLGATNPSVLNYSVKDPRPARRQAVAAALSDAKARAQSIAEGAGVRLGSLISAEDEGMADRSQDIIVTAQRRQSTPPPVVTPPVTIDVTPRPIEMTAKATVAYLIVP